MSASARQSSRRSQRAISTAFLACLVAGLVAILGGASACAPANNKAAIPQVRVLAEDELDCGPDEIRISEELGGRLLAVGCGRKQLYDARCEGVKCVVTKADGPALGWRDRPDP